jgi:hypothetical protein
VKQKKLNMKYYLLAFAVAATFGLSSCSSASDDTATQDDAVVANSKLIMTLNTTASTRALADDGQVDGTSSENYISGLRIFFCNSSDVIQYVVSSYDNVSNPTTVVVPLDKAGIPVSDSYHIYIGANLSDAAKTQLTAGANILTTIGSINSIDEVTKAKEFMMFGQALNGTSSVIAFTKGGQTSAAVDLNRIMAKILLTATTDADGNITDPNNAADINISNVKFTVLNTNSKYYFMQKLNGSVVEDPNFTMADYLSSTDFLNKSVTTSTIYKQAQSYTDDKLTGNDTGFVNNSIYCLENTTSASTYGSQSLLNNAAMKVATFVRISLIATPKLVDRVAYDATKLTDNKYYTYTMATGTDKFYCASSAALLAAHFGIDASNTAILAHDVTVPFTYDVFVNGKDFVADQTTTANSNVLRNHYYIMKIGTINTPFMDKFIEINTKITDWTIQGTTTKEIDSNGINN